MELLYLKCYTSGALWVCVVLNPSSIMIEKTHWQQLLQEWSRLDVCPFEDADNRVIAVGNHGNHGNHEAHSSRQHGTIQIQDSSFIIHLFLFGLRHKMMIN